MRDGETIDFLDELTWRGLIHQTPDGRKQITDEAELRGKLSQGAQRAYVGFDPTADSLTIGNLVAIMLLKHWQRAGHVPVVLMGGGTGLIGDPSGKSAERRLLDEDQVRENVENQKRIFERILSFDKDTPNAAVVENNIDWLGKLSYIEVLRDVGKHFSVNAMIKRDSVRDRLETREQGISYTEFSYMILQAYDFYHLHKEMDVVLQMGGSDQWGNIVSGTHLIELKQHDANLQAHLAREAEESTVSGPFREAFGLTAPLVTKSDGGKFGKTESGAVWLTADRTSPYMFYQFWLNAADDDVVKFLKLFTLLSKSEIEDLERAHAERPGAREAHRRLAYEATGLVHGHDQAEKAQHAAKALFSGELAELDERTLSEVFASAPVSEFEKSQLSGQGADVLEVATQAFGASKSQVRTLLAQGSITVNGTRKVALGDRLTIDDLLHGSVIALRRGKKHWHVTRWL